MEDVEAVPAGLRIDEFVVAGDGPGTVQDGMTVRSGQCVMPHDHQRQLGPLQLRRDSVFALSDL